MPTCWTCGATTEGFSYSCPTCQSVKGLSDIQHEVASAGMNIADLARIQQQGFEKLQASLTKGFSQLATIMEWGFNELSWRVQQQTEVLKEIDQTLKTPSETQANEYRLMADELKSRGVLDEAEEFYQKALALNRLDYRIYVGLAETQLMMNKFMDALGILERSLPHAPKANSNELGISDWKSYSLRLIGHIHACGDDYSKASSSLKSATTLSPYYSEGFYDYAQYSAQVGDTATCVFALSTAIQLKPLFWQMVPRQAAFKQAHQQVKELLLDIRAQAVNETLQQIVACENVIAGITFQLHNCKVKLSEFNAITPIIRLILIETSSVTARLQTNEILTIRLKEELECLAGIVQSTKSYMFLKQSLPEKLSLFREKRREPSKDIEEIWTAIQQMENRLKVYTIIRRWTLAALSGIAIALLSLFILRNIQIYRVQREVQERLAQLAPQRTKIEKELAEFDKMAHAEMTKQLALSKKREEERLAQIESQQDRLNKEKEQLGNARALLGDTDRRKSEYAEVEKTCSESENAKKKLALFPELVEKGYGKERRKDVEKVIAFLIQVHKEVSEETMTSKRANEITEDMARTLRTMEDFKILLNLGGKYKPIKDKNLTLEEAWNVFILKLKS